MKIIVGKDGDKDCIYVGKIPDIYDDEDWKKSELLLQKVCDLIKAEFAVTKGSDESSFIIEGEEISIFMDDLMPIGIYSRNVSGNRIIEKIFHVLNQEASSLPSL
ncbi:MAG: hypothetical protein V4598_08045 [Bdellovibrionota bacterium]